MGGNRRVTLAVAVVLVVLGGGLAQPVAAESGTPGVATVSQPTHSAPVGDADPADVPAGAANVAAQSNESGDHTPEHGGEHSSGHDDAENGTNASASSGGHDDSGGHGAASDGGDGHGSTGTLHLAFELVQIVLAIVAVGAVFLAGRVYGGEIGRALIISGAGVSLFAAQRLWHNFHELGFVGRPPALGEQTLFILASAGLAIGYLSLYRTMNTRLG